MSKKQDFHDRLALFIAYLKLKSTSFEKEMGFSNGSIGKLLDEKRAIGSDRLETIVSKYPKLNIQWLITGKGEMIAGYRNLEDEGLSIIDEPKYPSRFDVVKIPVTDLKVAAGQGYLNQDFINTVQTIELPQNMLKKGRLYLFVRIKGPSMHPTLQDGGYLLIRMLDKGEWREMENNHVYVIVDSESMAVTKRVRNRFANGFIVLQSDNPDKTNFPNYNLREEEIASIWHADWYLSAKMPNLMVDFNSQLDTLRNDIDDIKITLNELIEPKLKKP